MESDEEDGGYSPPGSSRGRGRGRGGKRSTIERSSNGGSSKKSRTVSPKYGVNDRVLYAILKQDADEIVAYALATVVKIVIDADGCLYTIHLDRDGTNQEGVPESELCKSVTV